jgi:aryl-alcohol dehydrogenase-like predicted oxidoreductase
MLHPNRARGKISILAVCTDGSSNTSRRRCAILCYNLGQRTFPNQWRVIMETRIFGRSGHASSVAIFGAVCLMEVDQQQANHTLDLALSAGVNHIDVAPQYGLAQERVGAWLPPHRREFFLGCKTLERSRAGANAELHDSLRKLQTDAFDLYQLHSVSTWDELDQATAPGGALEALLDARQAGLTRYLGITAHGFDAPAILLEALVRFDFDSVLFPVNFVLFANPAYRAPAEQLLQRCRQRRVGVMGIKAFCKGPWRDQGEHLTPWYEPFQDPAQIQASVDFSLSQDICGLPTIGDLNLLPAALHACENYCRLSAAEQETLLARAGKFTPLWQ